MNPILTPVLLLVAWSLMVAALMALTRLPAMRRLGLTLRDARHSADLHVLPSSVRQVSDNYNHLMEQPTIFYALAFYTYLAGHETSTTIMLAWAYVALRVVHSLIQCTVNVVMARFAVFALSTLALIAWAVIEVMAVL